MYPLTHPPCCCQVFRAVFDVAGWRSNCEAAAQGMRESVKTFRELLDHLSEVWMKVWEKVWEMWEAFLWEQQMLPFGVDAQRMKVCWFFLRIHAT